MRMHKENNKIKEKKLDNIDEYDDKFNVEDTTKYGEFISSFFCWVPPERQKEKANELNNMTRKK